MSNSPMEPGRGENSANEHPVSGLADGHVNALLDRSRSEFSSLPDELTRTLVEPFESALARAVASHATLVERLDRNSESNSEIETVDLAEFRRAVVTEVSAYLLDTVQRLDVGAVAGTAFTNRLARLREVAEAAPEFVLPANDAAESETTPDETAFGRARSLRARDRRKLRSWLAAASALARGIVKRNNGATEPPPGSVPLRQLLCYHVDQRIASSVIPMHERVQQAFAQRYAALERAATEWAFAVLALDSEFGLEDLVTLDGSAREAHPKDDDAPVEPSGVKERINEVRAAAGRLTGEKVLMPAEVLLEELRQAVDEVSTLLLSDLDLAGKPLLGYQHRQLPSSGTKALRALSASQERWLAWHREVVNRLSLNHSVLKLRENIEERATNILVETRAVALHPIMEAFDQARSWIETTGNKVANLFDRKPQPSSGDVAELLRLVVQEAADVFERMFPDSVARQAQSALTDIGVEEWDQLVESVNLLSDELPVHGNLYEAGATVEPQKRPFRIDLREIASNALSPPWHGSLSEAAEPLRARITRVWSAAEKLKNVIDYNLGAAIEELVGTAESDMGAADSPDAGEQSDSPSQYENARKLANDALRRSAELIDEQFESLDEPWSAFARTFDAEVHQDWSDLINQVKSDDLVSERWVGMRTRVYRLAERLWVRATDLLRRVLATGRKRVAVVQRIATRLIRRGRSAVGVAEADAEDAATIVEALRGAEDVRTALPLVYRRLYSFGVLTESALMVGRGRDQVNVRRRFETWGAGKGPGSLVIRAPLGSGRTSLLEALRTKVFEAATVHSLTFTERILTVETCAEALETQLGIVQGVRRPFDQIVRHLGNSESGPTVILVDNLEHLFLQAAGGTDLLRQVLTMMLRTDHTVFWVATVSDEGWRYVEKALSSSAASIGSYAVADLSRQDKEDLILKRHHRSGMTLEFTAPKDAAPLLKRRLRSAGTPEKRQVILQEIYFDALHRQSGNDIPLALLYWLRSIEFQEDDDLVVVRPFEAISFDQLKQLNLERLFALKAMVLHNTLTAAELGRILRIPVERCALIFESLLNLALIERATVDSKAVDQPIDTTVERLRLSRLVVYPVVQRLRDARVLY